MKIWLAAGAASTLALTGFAAPAFGQETQTYTYDALSRLVVVDYSGTINDNQAHSLCYDPAGNRTRYRSSSAGALASCVSSMLMSGGDQLIEAQDTGPGDIALPSEEVPAGETLPDVPPVADDGPVGINPIDGPLPTDPPPGGDTPPEAEGPGQ